MCTFMQNWGGANPSQIYPLGARPARFLVSAALFQMFFNCRALERPLQQQQNNTLLSLYMKYTQCYSPEKYDVTT